MNNLPIHPIVHHARDLISKINAQHVIYLLSSAIFIVIGETLIHKLLKMTCYAALTILVIALCNVIIKSDYFPLEEFISLNRKRIIWFTKAKQMIKVATD